MYIKVISFILKNLFLVLIVIAAFALRIAAIDKVPPSLNWDEVSHGYNAYSILKSGKDEWGASFPIIFKAYGDYKLPGYIYLTALSELFFGLNSFAVRLVSILAGVASVIFTYLLTIEFVSKDNNKLFANKSKAIAILASLLVAVEPWSFFLSRGAFEANLALAFFLSSLYLFFKSFDKATYLIFSAITLGLTVWTYNSYRIFTPLFLIALIFLYRQEISDLYKKSRYSLSLALISLLILLVPMFWQLFNPNGLARYGRVAILDEGAVGQIINLRENFKLNPTLERLMFNRPTFFVIRFLKNYVSHFSPKFVFVDGGTNYQFSIPGHGLIYIINLPFLVIGLVYFLKRKGKISLFILVWLLLAPIPSSLTREAPHVLRSITFLSQPMVLTAFGLVVFLEFLKSRGIGKRVSKEFLLLIYLLGVGIFALNYLRVYFQEYPRNYAWSWQYGYKQAVNYIKENYGNYDKIIITKKYGEPHEFILFNWPWDPYKYQFDANLIRFYQTNWYWVDRFDKFYFVNEWDVPKEEWQEFKLESGSKFSCQPVSKEIDALSGESRDSCLLVTSPGNYPKTWSKLKTINSLDGQVVFEIYEK